MLYYIPEFSVNLNAVVRDNQSIIMFLPDPVNKVIKSDDYCLNYFWNVISVDFEIPIELKDYDFENEASFGINENQMDLEGLAELRKLVA